MVEERYVTGPKGAKVYNGVTHEPTDEEIEAGVAVVPGLYFQGTFDEHGQPIGEVLTLRECVLPDSRGVWLNIEELAEVE